MSEIQVRNSRAGWDGPVRSLNISCPGAGKTSLMLSYPSVFVFDFDRTLHLGVPKHIRDRPEVKFMFVQPDSWQDVWVWTMRIVKGEPLETPEGKFQPKTIGVDTLGVAYNEFVTKVSRSLGVTVMMGKGGRPMTVLDARTTAASGDNQRAIMTQPDFGFSRDRLIEWLNELKKFPGHLVVSVHEQLRDPVEGSVKPAKGTVMLPGGLREDLPGMFDLYVRLSRAGTNPPQMQTAPDDLWPCKDRTGLLDPIEEADFQKFKKKLYPTGNPWADF